MRGFLFSGRVLIFCIYGTRHHPRTPTWHSGTFHTCFPERGNRHRDITPGWSTRARDGREGREETRVKTLEVQRKPITDHRATGWGVFGIKRHVKSVLAEGRPNRPPCGLALPGRILRFSEHGKPPTTQRLHLTTARTGTPLRTADHLSRVSPGYTPAISPTHPGRETCFPDADSPLCPTAGTWKIEPEHPSRNLDCAVQRIRRNHVSTGILDCLPADQYRFLL